MRKLIMSVIWMNFGKQQLVQRYALLVCLSSLVMGIQGCSIGGQVGIGPVSFGANANLGSSPTQASQETSNQVSQLVNDANQKFNQRDFKGAIASLDQVIALAPNEAIVYYYRGNVYLNDQNPTVALADFEQALKLQPDKLEFKKARLLANTLIKTHQNNLQGSRSDFEELIKLDPQDAVSYYHRGLWNRAMGNEAAAIGDFQQALKIQPDLAIAKKALEQNLQ
jgi:tetratricopeptide (TPR) repeat protein